MMCLYRTHRRIQKMSRDKSFIMLEQKIQYIAKKLILIIINYYYDMKF